MFATRIVILVFVIPVAIGISRMAMQAPPIQPQGCYRFDRPLGGSATGALERGDSSWYQIQLLAAGAVARPTLADKYWREQYAERSHWREQADTLFVRVSTGLVGWDLTLTARGGGYDGTARYLTDATGGAPYVVAIHGAREACPRAAPA